MVRQLARPVQNAETRVKKRHTGPPAPDSSAAKMSILRDRNSCEHIIKRLKQCEAKVCGIQAHIDGGKCCLEAAEKLTEIREELDRIFARMAIGYLEQELDARLIASAQNSARSAAIKVGMGKLLSRISEQH